ncbi:MAG: multiheme c-type cytochrome [Rhodocyclales bacterium]|nr:multiheme c-type cytochrome [Rhodocyclales bacterium]
MMRLRSRKSLVVGIVLLALITFLAWRLIRPMNIFVVTEAFERPVSTAGLPQSLQSLSANDCASCHQEFYQEWSTSIHSQAWTDPYFQVDWAFDGKQQVCKNCHIPLDRQQEHKVAGFKDDEKWQPILEPNPAFDAKLQHEGVTCAACHLRDGKILGPYGSESTAHPVEKLANPNEVCFKCHVVGGNRWDTFFRVPPCGTVAEIRSTPAAAANDAAGQKSGRSGDASPDCVQCHMPLAERPLVAGGKVRTVRRHLWRGGHDPEMVKQGLDAALREAPAPSPDKRSFTLTLTNKGAAHYLPTGTPDRHLTASIRLVDRNGIVLREDHHVLKRNILWRPFIVDLRDTRLPRWQPRVFRFDVDPSRDPTAVTVEAQVQYHLLNEDRRRRIGYENKEPIAYDVFRARIGLNKEKSN